MSRGAAPSRRVETFLEMLAAERGAAANTIDSYRRDLSGFSAFAQARGRSPEDADASIIKDYMAHTAGAGMAASTAARRLSVLRQFFRFLYSEGFRGDDPSAAMDSPRQASALPKYLSEEEVDRLLTAAAGRPGAEGKRLNAMVEILYATGLRVSELVGLPLSAVSEEGRMLVVRGKGGKERMVPLSEPADDAIKAYALVREKFLPGKKASAPASSQASPWLFPSRSKTGFLTRARFAQLLKELAFKAGIDPARVSPHVLRHSFASHLLAHGADLRSLQRMLGHSDISSTQIYTHVLDQHLKRLVEKAHPLSGKVAGKKAGDDD